MLSEGRRWQPESQASLWEAEFCSWIHWGRETEKDSKCVSSLIDLFFPFFSLSFLIYISVEHGETKEGRWLSGANRWIQTYMEGLPGCVIVFLLCALSHVCLYYPSVWLSLTVSVSDFCLASTHLHTHTQGGLLEHKSSFNFLMILITWSSCSPFEPCPPWFQDIPETSTHYVTVSGSVHGE